MKKYWPAVLVSTLLAVSACSSNSTNTVRLLVHDSFALPQSVIDKFEKESGLDLVIIKSEDAGTMTAGAVLASGNPTADVIFGVDNLNLARAVSAEVFSSYQSQQAEALLPELKTELPVTAIDFGDVCLNYDIDYFESRDLNPPSSLDDLIKPVYADLLVVEDAAASSPGTAFLLATISKYGSDWTNYWNKLFANGAKVAGSWSDAYFVDFTKGGGSGDRPLVVSYASSPPAEWVYAEEPKPTKVSTAVMANDCFRQIEYAGVLRGAANESGAQQVIDWLLSEEVQRELPLSMFVLPARSGVELPEAFVEFSPQITNPRTVPSDEISAQLGNWLSTWDSLRNG